MKIRSAFTENTESEKFCSAPLFLSNISFPFKICTSIFPDIFMSKLFSRRDDRKAFVVVIVVVVVVVVVPASCFTFQRFSIRIDCYFFCSCWIINRIYLGEERHSSMF